MTALIPFVFEEQLVRAVERHGAPWFVGKDVCHCLGLKNANDALGGLDNDEKGVATTDPLAPGGEQTVIVISEPGVYRLVFRSRKPEAERFKRWLAHEVLPKLRRDGAYGHAPDAQRASEGSTQDRLSEADLRAAPLLHRLQCLREIRAIRGRQVAAVMWNRLGLPALPPPPPTAADEARQCLRHILDAVVAGEGPMLRVLIERALDDDHEAALLLLSAGVRVLPESEAFAIANDHPFLRQLFKGTEWSEPRGHMRVLRRLPGASAGAQHRYGSQIQRRGTVLPGNVLDEE